MPSPELYRLVAPLAALLLAGLATPAHARDGQFFLRGEIGNADSDFDFRSGDDTSDNERARTARAGYYFNRHFGVEGFYGKLYDGRLFGPTSWTISYDAQVNASGIGVIGKYRFGESRGFFVQGRGGLARYRTRTTFAYNLCAGLVPCPTYELTEDDSTNAYYGVGAGYDFNKHVGVGVNYDVHESGTDSVDIDTRALTTSLEIRF
jgi:hypothetical protein